MRKFYALAVALTAALLLAACGGQRTSPTATVRHAAPAGATPQSAMGSVAPAGWGQSTGPVPLTLAPSTPTATMYDAVTIGNIPAGAFAAAGYTAGLYPTWSSLLSRFPHAHHISVAISAIYHADCLDVEPYDAVPSQAGAWVRADIRAGFPRPCVYSDLSEMPAVRASLAAAGLNRSQYLLWLAWYRGIPGLVSGYDAVQYDDHCLSRGLDCSTVSLDFLKAAQPPYVAPKPKPKQPVCIHRRESRKACAAAKAKIASDQRAAAASQRAYTARGCQVLSHRVSWFSTQLHKHPHVRTTSRRRALTASRAAYRQRSCATFAQRDRFFTGRAAALQAAN